MELQVQVWTAELELDPLKSPCFFWGMFSETGFSGIYLEKKRVCLKNVVWIWMSYCSYWL